MSDLNLALSVLLATLLFAVSPNLRRLASVGIAFWVWLICLLLSGMVSWLIFYIVGESVGNSDGWPLLVLTPIGWLVIALFFLITSDLAFLVLYRCFGYGIFMLIERRWKVKLAKPSTRLGFVFAPFSPVIIWFVYSAFSTR